MCGRRATASATAARGPRTSPATSRWMSAPTSPRGASFRLVHLSPVGGELLLADEPGLARRRERDARRRLGEELALDVRGLAVPGLEMTAAAAVERRTVAPAEHARGDRSRHDVAFSAREHAGLREH